MDTQDSQNSPAPKKRRPRIWLIILVSLFLLLFSVFTALFFGFNYFGERLLRKYLQDKILLSSDSLYHADFKKLNLNILTGKLVMDSFELTPDTVQYQRLKSEGKVARALYKLSFESLTIDKLHFRQIYAGKRINFRQLVVDYPKLSIVGFPDTIAAKRNKWKVVYEDLYPAVSGFFSDFHIDSVKVNRGLFLTSSSGKTGRETTGEYEYSARLKDVSVNPYSYYNRERVFYSRDIDLVVHNFEYNLADSLYSLKADEIGFSLTDSILYGKKVSLVPNFDKIRIIHGGDLFSIDLPAFSISGIDLYRAMTDRKVEVSGVNLADFLIRVYRNKTSPGTVVHKKSRKKITIAGLYTVVARELKFIDIDTLSLNNGSFEFFGSTTDFKPELKIGSFNLELNQFRLDSVTHLDQSRIFYSRAIELDIANISLVLRDGIHSVTAAAIKFSTKKSLIDVQEASIFPDRTKNLLKEDNRRNMMLIRLPRLTFTGIDLKKVFNRRILDFNRLTIDEPDILYTRYQPAKNPDPRFKKPEDFFASENEEVVYDLLKKYLWIIRGNEIEVSHGFARFSAEHQGSEIPIASSSFSLLMTQFLIDSVHGMNEQGYFYSRDFDLDLQAVSIASHDSLSHLKAARIYINTRDSLIEAKDISFYKMTSQSAFRSSQTRPSVSIEFTLQKLHLTGLNHKKLFLEKILKANQIVFDNPILTMKTSPNQNAELPPDKQIIMKTGKMIRTFEIGRCVVRKGAFLYDGEEDRKASYFQLRDIDFALVNATVHIPEKGRHDGLIKFDSLQLQVIPLRAVIADSSYVLEARSLEVHSYPANIIVRGIKVTPLKSGIVRPGGNTLAGITIPEIRLHGFYFDKAIFEKQWLVEGIYVERPALSIEMIQDKVVKNEQQKTSHFDPVGLIEFPAFMKTVAVSKLSIVNADARLIIRRHDSTRSWSLNNMMLQVNRFRVDSFTRSNPGNTPLFNADDITFSSPGFSWASSDSMYTYAFGRFGFSTGAASAFVDSVSITPNYSRSDFSQTLGYQTDRIELQIPGIKVSQVDFRKLSSERQLHASKVILDGLVFQSYRDKRFPFPSWQRPLMPTRMVAGISFPISFDTIALSNGYASYEEQTGPEPGRIWFDQMSAKLTGFVTQSANTSTEPRSNSLDLHATTRIMGIAPTEAWFHFKTNSPTDSFTIRATVRELHLPAINPMLSKLLPANIRRGTATSTEIINIIADSSKATGILNFRYHNLAIQLQPTRPGTWHLIEQALLTEAVNLYLADRNPNEAGKMKTGIIYYERDPSKGFFNFVWKSILSGIKSSVGVNTKAQREIKKQLKRKEK